eukprot:gb/GEZN01001816.1/.p1 GENE.gb/GEZN01001816.1/~~gb/GEZN01001816.1/.p1  ORF type:complete len:892 (+),score=103.73 gb/GEZN01001816.1/:400-2676(+)
MGAVEKLGGQRVQKLKTGWSNLAIVLEWPIAGSPEGSMYAPVVRGMPYATMEYKHATPRLAGEMGVATAPTLTMEGKTAGPAVSVQAVDSDLDGTSAASKVNPVVGCGNGTFGAPFTIHRELTLHFKISDMTWLVFPSQAIEVVCWSNASGFELRATKKQETFVWRVAISNNCTTGRNPIFCNNSQPQLLGGYATSLRRHAHVYPSGDAHVRFLFPSNPGAVKGKVTTQRQQMEGQTDTMEIVFDWAVKRFAPTPGYTSNLPSDRVDDNALMYSLPHHDLLRDPEVLDHCWPTMRGFSCPTVGNVWVTRQPLVDVSLYSASTLKEEIVPDIKAALKEDLKFSLPKYYMKGAGDTYFSGKQLAKLARIIIIAHEAQARDGIDQSLIDDALLRLQQGVEIWLNGSATSPLLYDKAWGGLVSCGCDFKDDIQDCANRYPDCPALTNPGMNFGNGFYNDHHFHYGYHIYAAAVVGRFNKDWLVKYHQHVIALVRDIANPSMEDPYFPQTRHKDWYLGSSWANGIVPVNPNGRNQESSSEAIHAYEAVALFGQVLAGRAGVGGSTGIALDDIQEDIVTLCQLGDRVEQIGRVLLSTELSAAQIYWHVRKNPAPNCVATKNKQPCRVYPASYRPMAVGMLWSFMANFQTWFGPEAWKSYGIQLMPLTVAAGARDDPEWVKEMLPEFTESCLADPICVKEGWSILVHACQGTIGQWQMGWKGIMALNSSVFTTAGGNGHSRTNSLWYIASRPDPNTSVALPFIPK